MIDPIARILAHYPATFFQFLIEHMDSSFAKAERVTQQHYAEPERANMLGQARHACCEEGFRMAAQDAGLVAIAPHTKPAGGRYSLVSHGGRAPNSRQRSSALRTSPSNEVPQRVGSTELLA